MDMTEMTLLSQVWFQSAPKVDFLKLFTVLPASRMHAKPPNWETKVKDISKKQETNRKQYHQHGAKIPCGGSVTQVKVKGWSKQYPAMSLTSDNRYRVWRGLAFSVELSLMAARSSPSRHVRNCYLHDRFGILHEAVCQNQVHAVETRLPRPDYSNSLKRAQSVESTAE